MKNLSPDQKYNYRSMIYSKYVSVHLSPNHDVHRLQDAMKYYFKDLLPQSLDAEIFDMGCGSGIMLNMLENLGFQHLTGVDISEEQVLKAKVICHKAVIQPGNLTDLLDQNPERFDLIIGLDIIEHFGKEEIIPLLTSIFRSLKPGGKIILQTPNLASPFVGSISHGDFTHEGFFTPNLLRELLYIVGLINYEARPVGPYIHGIRSLLRVGLWKIIVFLLGLVDLAEIGEESKIYTRVFIASAMKPL